MRRGFRQSMAWLHTWSGLVTGWVMFCVFVTGTATYYRTDISLWMRPELRAAAVAPGVAAERGAAYLKVHAPKAVSWFVALPQEDRPLIGVYWLDSFEAPIRQASLDAETGQPTTARATQGGDFLYRFHYELQMMPMLGRWIVGASALILLVALVSGIVTHRRIFSDFFTFRRDRSAQRGWLDAHNVTGVLALPFHLMITYTGIVTLAFTLMPWGIASAYRGDEMRFYVEAGQTPAWRAAAGRPAEALPLAPLVDRARAEVSEPLEMVIVNNPGDAASTVVAVFEEPKGLAHRHPQVAFEAVSGEVVARLGTLKPAAHAFTSFLGLHEAHFAGPALRVLFFLCGLMGSATIATGLVLWSVARAPKPGTVPGFGLRLVRGLNLGTVLGLPIGIAAFVLANRLLPVALEARAAWEGGAFFAAWGLAALVGFARPHGRTWREMGTVAGLLFLSLPLVGALTTDRGLDFVWFDLAMVAIAAGLGSGAWTLSRYEDVRRTRVARTAQTLARA
ncbi:MAG: PepSY-associated TM helix domain-containing protein [Methylobacterium sp.]|uniref:PepSY-associated TM helix domain-containing protein n=1 Tax=Methylobacterium sp. TaxID=409 RepID=UPI002715A148|nr:PepSY-associated TM helix domain-containing protein [Methylobacterium sp.]MDO9425642.1 PepSY-associated TM helix domain-containing protein [Methylobacterium sp.]